MFNVPGSSKSETPVGSLERKHSSSSSRTLAKRMTRILVGEGNKRYVSHSVK